MPKHEKKGPRSARTLVLGTVGVVLDYLGDPCISAIDDIMHQGFFGNGIKTGQATCPLARGITIKISVSSASGLNLQEGARLSHPRVDAEHIKLIT